MLKPLSVVVGADGAVPKTKRRNTFIMKRMKIRSIGKSDWPSWWWKAQMEPYLQKKKECNQYK